MATIGDALAGVHDAVLPKSDMTRDFMRWVANATKSHNGLSDAIQEMGLQVEEGDGYFERLKNAWIAKQGK